MTLDVHLALVEFGQLHERAALDTLVPMLGRVFPGSMLRTVIVDNALDGDMDAHLDGSLHRLSGDNTMREFSGWDRALTWLEHRYRPAAASIVVLANDTVVRPDKCGRVRAIQADRAAAALHGALVGWVEEYPRSVELFGSRLRQWVDTSLVITQWRTLASLLPLARPLGDQIFSTDWRAPFREPSPLSQNYRAYLKTYFCGDSSVDQFDHRWYAQQPLTEQNFNALKRKLDCVFCEHLFSARARDLGIPLVDIRDTPLAIDPHGPARSDMVTP